MKKLYVILIFVMASVLISPVTAAWGASSNIAYLDAYSDTSYCSLYGHGYSLMQSATTGTVCLDDVSGPWSFTEVSTATIDSGLAGYDTLILWGVNPSSLSVTTKIMINFFVFNGGKLIIWDSEDPGTGNVWDYSWLARPFAAVSPGETGEKGGTLSVVEENTLSSADMYSPYYIYTSALATYTDAVMDANIVTTYSPYWCVDMEAANVINHIPTIGPTALYASYNNGVIMYSGLDYDDAGSGYGCDYKTGYACWLSTYLRHQLMTSSLPFTNCGPGNLEVTKVSDKTTYAVGETIQFTVTVHNHLTVPAFDAVLTDTPPKQISCSQTIFNLGMISAGSTTTQQVFTCTAVSSGCGLENAVSVVGDDVNGPGGLPFYSGTDLVTFDIGSCVPSVPEFPTLALPASLIIGLLGTVLILKRTREQ